MLQDFVRHTPPRGLLAYTPWKNQLIFRSEFQEGEGAGNVGWDFLLHISGLGFGFSHFLLKPIWLASLWRSGIYCIYLCSCPNILSTVFDPQHFMIWSISVVEGQVSQAKALPILHLMNSLPCSVQYPWSYTRYLPWVFRQLSAVVVKSFLSSWAGGYTKII